MTQDEVRRRPGGRSAEVTAKVRAATLELIAEVGYDGLQLGEVAARAGVNRTTVYRRWPTKPELVAHLLTDLADEQAPDPDTGSLAGDLEVMLSDVAALLDLRAVRSVLRATITLADDDPAIDRLRRDFWDRQLVEAAVVVTRAVERGEVPAGTDARPMLERVFGPLYFRSLVLGSPMSPSERHDLVRTAVG